MAIIKLEGQEIPIDDAIALDDTMLRNALTPFYPDAAHAEITRETKDGQTIVRMVKRAGTKGTNRETGTASVLNQLIQAETGLNPALELCWQLKSLEIRGKLDLEALVSLQDNIRTAIAQGETEVKQVEKTLRLLLAAPPIPAQMVLPGF
jgi:hypothetical protein